MRTLNGGAGSGDVQMLEYDGGGDGGGDARGQRLPLVAFLWSLCAPWAVAGVIFILGEGMIDIDDRLPRWGVFTVFGCVGIGIPLAGVVLGAVALTRPRARGGKWLAATAILLGGAWCVAAAVLLWLVEKA